MNEPDLFSDEARPKDPDTPREDRLASSLDEHRVRVRRSALWAAYGDALGWISELTDAPGLKRRTGGAPLRQPVEWKRRVGGRSGVTVSLPEGCYSDDSQLRLATGRAIRTDGFDVEAFAKVELPVWPSYALGGGKSTTAAATYLAKPKSSWWRNTFKGWTASGGNGAAMRIQPHVWAARAPDDPSSFLPQVTCNAVCTHSHPTGLMGAILHALCVARAMTTGRLPSPDDLLAAVGVAEGLPGLIADDMDLRYWRVAFEQASGDFGDAWATAVEETRHAVQLVGGDSAGAERGEERYESIIEGLQLRKPERRGSGMLTAVAAVGLTWCESCPQEAMRVAANTLGTDTDTIATMAGAILGAVAESEPPLDVLDADLFRAEADRLAEIAAGGNPRSHSYPDLLRWSAPKTRADALVRSGDGGLVVRGLGRVIESVGEPVTAPGGNFAWQWLRLESGQTLLMKHRRDLSSDIEKDGMAAAGKPGLGDGTGREGASASPPGRRPMAGEPDSGPCRRGSGTPPSGEVPRRSGPRGIQETVAHVSAHIEDNDLVGRALRRVVNKGSPEEILEFTAALIRLLREPNRPE